MKYRNDPQITATESNLKKFFEDLAMAVKSYNDYYAANGGNEQNGKIKANLQTKWRACTAAQKKVNQVLAAEYYAATEAKEILSNTNVPCVVLDTKGDSVVIVFNDDTKTKPSLYGLEPFLPEGTYARCDVLRRAAAYLELSGCDGAILALTGSETTVGNKSIKKDVPTEEVKNMLATMFPNNKISKTAVKALFEQVLVELSDETIKPLITSAMLADFGRFCISRGGQWGTRRAASQSLVGDIVLEYVYMLLNNKGKFTVVCD